MKKLVLTIAAVAALATAAGTPAEAHGLRPHRGIGTAAAIAVAATAAAVAANTYGYGYSPYYYGYGVPVVYGAPVVTVPYRYAW